MRGKELDQGWNKLRRLLWMVMATCIILTGCMRWGQPLLSRAVIQYDTNVLKSDKELLLLNIVRMHDDQPPHFTAASSITAAFTFTSTGGIGGSGATGWTDGAHGHTIGGLSLAATATNSPTLTIAPMQGKEFAQRLLKPIDPAFANTLLFQKTQQSDKMLRLIGQSFVMANPQAAKETFEMIHPNDAGGVVQYPLSELKKRGCFTSARDEIEGLCLINNRPRMKPIEQNIEGLTGDIKDIDIDTEKNTIKTITVGEGKDHGMKFSIEDAKVIVAKPTGEGMQKEIIHVECQKEDTINCLKQGMPVYVEYKKNKEGEFIADRILEDDNDYKLFRQIVLHIKAMLLVSGLNVVPLYFEFPVDGTTRTAKDLSSKDFKDTIDAWEKEYRWEKTTESVEQEGFILTEVESEEEVKDTFTSADALDGKEMKNIIAALKPKYYWKQKTDPEYEKKTYRLKKRHRVISLLNFDFTKMCEQNQKALLNKIENDLGLREYLEIDQGVIIVILQGSEKKKNEWPIYGLFRLRNFRQVLQFLAESLKDQAGYEKEYNVAPNGLTEKFLDNADVAKVKFGDLDNPPLTLTVTSGGTRPEDSVVDVDYNGELFWVSSPQKQTEPKIEGWENRYPLRWDKQIFDMLYEIFQFNRVEPSVSAPSLTLPASK